MTSNSIFSKLGEEARYSRKIAACSAIPLMSDLQLHDKFGVHFGQWTYQKKLKGWTVPQFLLKNIETVRDVSIAFNQSEVEGLRYVRTRSCSSTKEQ